MNTEALAALKSQCQTAADAFQRLQSHHDGIPHEQLEFNHAVLLALKAVYEITTTS
ncbi:MAG TPA: hypothetical protein VNF68_08715 [Candidatus Baltobacteraceae bacterium]|nr:hypothetical protein [Candidatus Baltobacteraceae bacterium]